MESLLDQICDQYLNSRDFNGYSLYGVDEAMRGAAASLVKEDLAEVISEKDYLTPTSGRGQAEGRRRISCRT